jgi:hypothetical protein
MVIHMEVLLIPLHAAIGIPTLCIDLTTVIMITHTCMNKQLDVRISRMAGFGSGPVAPLPRGESFANRLRNGYAIVIPLL